MTLVVGLLTQHLGTATVIRFIACALALIVVVFAWQARSHVWIVAIAAVAVLWNPAFPLPFSGVGWDAAHVLAATIAMAAALFVRQRMEGTSVRASR
ncbi:hypothetical protein E6C64_10580 [Naasia lichenicola]|uniref:Uncharacterized protein n=1 Tax=Naasia lichenicola TaxID=2565933 RepID=A0A4S4FLR7_9MICO|nr:DUF6804 family protein [Naasia lichenicola]THG31034.1 hypothetical protein E6C64_10580 [Naasia lichenicola]